MMRFKTCPRKGETASKDNEKVVLRRMMIWLTAAIAAMLSLDLSEIKAKIDKLLMVSVKLRRLKNTLHN